MRRAKCTATSRRRKVFIDKGVVFEGQCKIARPREDGSKHEECAASRPTRALGRLRCYGGRMDRQRA